MAEWADSWMRLLVELQGGGAIPDYQPNPDLDWPRWQRWHDQMQDGFLAPRAPLTQEEVRRLLNWCPIDR